MHAYCMEWLENKLQPGARVLDVGCGSGYLLATFYELCKKTDGSAAVFGIEHVQELADFSQINLNKSYSAQLTNGAIQVICGDGREGYAAGGPFDAIHVGAAAAQVPQALLQQLSPNGTLVIPVGPDGGNQVIKRITKSADANKFVEENLLGVRYVPLTSVQHQVNRY